MGKQVYSNREYKIYEVGKNNYIVHNSHKPFQEGHTHIHNFSTAKYLTKLATHKLIPDHLSEYLLVSLIRISKDNKYIEAVKKALAEQHSSGGNTNE